MTAALGSSKIDEDRRVIFTAPLAFLDPLLRYSPFVMEAHYRSAERALVNGEVTFLLDYFSGGKVSSTKVKSTAFAKRESVVHFEAFVKYKDVFDGERETCFKKIWVVYEMGGQALQHWVECGKPEDNQETRRRWKLKLGHHPYCCYLEFFQRKRHILTTWPRLHLFVTSRFHKVFATRSRVSGSWYFCGVTARSLDISSHDASGNNDPMVRPSRLRCAILCCIAKVSFRTAISEEASAEQ